MVGGRQGPHHRRKPEARRQRVGDRAPARDEPQQLFGWQRDARALFSEEQGAEASATPGSASSGSPAATAVSKSPGPSPAFAPVVLVAPVAAPPPGSGGPPSDSRAKGGVIEIVIGGMVVRVTGPVDADALATVLAVARRAAR